MAEEIPTRRTRRRRNNVPQSLRGPHLADKMAANQEKRRQALILRRSGMTYDQIAKQMQLSTSMMAWRYVNDAIAAIPREEAIECKALAVAKLDAQEVRLNRLLQEKEGRMSVQEHCRIELALVRVAERRAKLQGHDAPIRTELTGKDGAALSMTVTDLEGMTDDQLDRIVRTAVGQATRGGSAGAEETETPGEDREARRAH